MAKTLQGVVVSDVNNKTIVVNVATRKTHSLYKKAYSTSKKYKAHDEKNEAKIDDVVIIVETRPISKDKHFKLDKIIGSTGIQHKEESATEVDPIAAKAAKLAEEAEEAAKLEAKQAKAKTAKASKPKAEESK